MAYEFKITKDRIFDPEYGIKSVQGKTYRAGSVDEIDHTIRSNFSVYDDDLNCYFEGVLYGDFDGFEPLDDLGRGYGCTRIKIDGEWL